MKLTALFENENKYLYHVTFTKNVPRIKKKGLIQFEPSNWVQRGTGERYNEDAGIFAFDDPEDAFRWAFKMKWDLDDKDISIVRINIGEHWEDDPAGETMKWLYQIKGRSLRSSRNRKAEEIIDSFNFDEFGSPKDLGISQEEWIDQIVKTLRS